MTSPLSSLRFLMVNLACVLILAVCCPVQAQTEQEIEKVTVRKSTKPESDKDLIVETLKAGEGTRAKVGDDVLIHEETRYRDGTLIFSTDQMGKPLRFTIGGNMVIKGVDEGVRGMQRGEIRKLVVPPAFSQRTSYPDIISPDSILVYTIEMVDIIPKQQD